MKAVYIFDKEQLAYRRVSFKPFLVLPVVLLLAVAFNYFYFFAPICDYTDWKGETEKVTVQEYINNYLIEK